MLKEISGQKIRRQYFNIPIYLLLSMWAAIISGWFTASIVDQTVGSEKWFEDALFLFALMAVLLLPLLLLSVVNRCCFGKVICVLNDRGLFYEDNGVHHIVWNDIKQILYEPDVTGKVGYRWLSGCNTAYVTIKPFQKKVEIELVHAPFSLLRKVKKHNPNVKCGFTSFGWVMVFFYLFGPSVVNVLVTLFG